MNLQAKVHSITAATLIAVGASPSLNASVSATGADNYGQLAVPAAAANAIDVSAGRKHSVALLPNGAVVAWGYSGDNRSAPPAGLSGVVAVDAGSYHTLAVKTEGSVVGWGFNTTGSLAIPAFNDAVAVAAGAHHSLVLRANGAVVGWGFDGDQRATPPPGLTGVIAIDAGVNHSVALKSNGTVVAWGGNQFGQTNVPSDLTGVVAISASGSHTLALKSNRSVVAWGLNDFGQCSVPSGLTGIAAIAAGNAHSLALRNDGSVAAWGGNSNGQLNLGSYSNVTAIAAGGLHSLAVIANGPVIASQPQSQTVTPGTDVSFSVSVPEANAFQWLVGGVPIEGAVTSTLEITAVSRGDAGSYSVIAGDDKGFSYSQDALLIVRSLQRVADPEFLANGTIRLTFGDELGYPVAYDATSRFSLQASYDLEAWFTVHSPLIWIDGQVIVEDLCDLQLPAKFYRIVDHDDAL